MIFQRNSRFTNLVFIVLLGAPAFMVPTHTQGAFARAVARNAGMRRVLPNQMIYGFSLVDLIADNPFKSGFVATGVIALIAYLASNKVRKPVNAGFSYVGGRFSWLGHQVILQYKMRVKKYSDQEIQKLNEQSATDEVPALQAAKNNLADATGELNRAREALTRFEQDRPYRESMNKGVLVQRADQQEKQKEEADQKESKQEKAEAVVAAQSQTVTSSDLDSEHLRLLSAFAESSKKQRAAQVVFDKAKEKCDEYNVLIGSIARRRGCDQNVLCQANNKLLANEMEIDKLTKRTDLTESESQRLNTLIAERRTLLETFNKKKTENQKVVGSRTQTSQVPAVSSSQSQSSAAASSSVSGNNGNQTASASSSERADSVFDAVGTHASSNTLSSSSSALLCTTSAGAQ